jgi:MraZ protein
LLGHAKDCSLDSQGRIPIPPLLRDYARLGKKVVLMGQGTKYEIWDAETFNALRDDWIDEQAGIDDMGESTLDIRL